MHRLLPRGRTTLGGDIDLYEPTAAGNEPGATTRGVGLAVSPIGEVSSVALSNVNHRAWYCVGGDATFASTAALVNVKVPWASTGRITGFTFGK